mmetsp:Transcript_39257/g.77716  ORF Transcript_39257/g.77716 Transcript_39257/m.77716 type:complete len:83 (-) Transcript_39257:56-304(-)
MQPCGSDAYSNASSKTWPLRGLAVATPQGERQVCQAGRRQASRLPLFAPPWRADAAPPKRPPWRGGKASMYLLPSRCMWSIS